MTGEGRALVAELARGSTAAILCAGAAAVLLAARNDLPPVQQPVSFLLVFWGALAALYVGAAVVVVGVAALLRRGSATRRWAPALLPSIVAAWLIVVAIAHPRAVSQAAFPWMPGPKGWLGAAAFWLLPTAAVAVALPRLASRARYASALAALIVAAAAAHVDPSGDRVFSLPPSPSPKPALVVIGIDGADWTYLEPVMARGMAPHLESLRRRGAWGRLATIQPTVSPAIWTTIATGHRPQRHGVESFTFEQLFDIEAPYRVRRPVRWTGWRLGEDLLRRRRALRLVPVGSAARRVPAYWEIASAAGLQTVVVHWWATWPAEAIAGAMVSDRLYYDALVGVDPARSGSAHPPSLVGSRRSAIRPPESITYEEAREYIDVTPVEYEAMRQVHHPSPLTGFAHEFTYFVSLFETARGMALSLAAPTGPGGPRPDLLVLFRIVDQMSHTALHLSPLVEDHVAAGLDERRRFGRAVEGAYAGVDRAVGEILERYPGANVLVVSDHGFVLEGRGDNRGYNHNSAPPGVFLAAGPSVRPGEVEGLSVYDIMPLMCYLKGLPVSEEFRTRAWTRVVDDRLLAAAPPARIAGYGDRNQGLRFRRFSETDAEELERLRALGYVQ